MKTLNDDFVMDYKTVKMPFGKYKGRFILEIPDVAYFVWLYNNTNLPEEILFAVKHKLNII